MPNFAINDVPHRRLNLLTGESILVSPHRSKRPWQGQVEDLPADNRPEYDPTCYLCPRNPRADGSVNPDYKESFVFVNDFSALLKDSEEGEMNEEGLLIAETERGICKVIAFSPRHDLTLPEMDIPAIRKVVDVWQSEFASLAENDWIKYIQIFENKGSIMGCSNPHPHGQIWAESKLPMEIQKEEKQQKEYFEKNGHSLLSDYLALELKKKERIIVVNEHFVALVPFWAAWPFETLVISKRQVKDIREFTDAEKTDLAKTLQELTIRYDNIFSTSFPYSAGMHQAPVNSGNQDFWHWHMHFYPPLLRSATVKKFMVGYEMLANPQRDITAEKAAEIIRNQPTIHYKSNQMIERDQISVRFKELYGTEPTLVSKSPGRINIIGEHTDYNEGFVLPTAIDKAVYVALSKRTDSEIHLYAEDFKEPYSVDLKEVAPSDKGWPNYILGVVNQLKNRGLELSGFNLYIDGDIPVGAGLSSSAAVECATGYGLNELFGLGLDKVDIAKIGQLAEHTYAGVKCGIMDQFASVLSKAKHVVRLDCRDLSYTYVPLELGEYEIVLLNTNVKHSLASSAYNDRRYACEHAVSLIQKKHAEVKSLRDVDIVMLDELVKPFDEDSYIKARFVVEENERLAKACDAMESGDIVEMGRQMFRAHEGLSKEYEVSCQELDFLVEKAKHFPEVLGARMMGGGFGGCTINIVKKGFGQQLVEALAPAYKNEFNLELTPIFVKTDNGSELVY